MSGDGFTIEHLTGDGTPILASFSPANYTPVISGPFISDTIRGHLAGIDNALFGLSSDHGSLGGLGDDDHPQYLFTTQSGSYPGRAGGQRLTGGTTSIDELGLRGSSNANTGLIRAYSPMVFEDNSPAASLSAYFLSATPTQTFSVGYVGGGYNASPNITFTNAFFIWEGSRVAPTITSGVAPGFAAFTLLQALPVLNSGASGGYNPIAPLVLNAGPVVQNTYIGSRIATQSVGMNWAPQTRSTVSGASMTVTKQTAVLVHPTWSTITGSVSNLGTIRGVEGQSPSVALFQSTTGTEQMFAYYLVDMAQNITLFPSSEVTVVRNSSLTAGANRYFLRNIGGAQSNFGSGTITTTGTTTLGGALAHTGSTLGLLGAPAVTQAADIGALIDNIGGTVALTLAALTDPAAAPATATILRDDLVANIIPEIRDALSSLANQINDIRNIISEAAGGVGLTA